MKRRAPWQRRTAPLVLIVALCACQELRSAPLTPVVVQLKWTHCFQFAGYYAALHRGMYEEAGLEVELREAQPDINPVVEVASGSCEFGIGLSSILLERSRGRPITLLANVFQHSALALAVRPGLPTAPVDALAGRRLMLDPAGAEIVAGLKKLGLGREDYTILPHTFRLADLLDGQVDAMSIYVTDDLYKLEGQPEPYHLVQPRMLGVDFYGDNIYTSSDFITQHPQTAEAFVAASLKGWQYALTHEEELVELIRSQYAPHRSRKHLLFEAARTRELIMPDVVQIGYINPQRWQNIADTYTELGMLPEGFSLDGFLPNSPPPKLPAWVMPALWGTLTLSALAVGIGGYVIRINRQLREARERERRTHEDAQRLLERKLRAALTASAVAHEIQQPLSRIRLAADMAEAVGEWTPLVLDSLTHAAGEVSHTVDKMNVLLRSVQTPLESIDLCNVVQSSVHQVASLALEHGVDVRAHTAMGSCLVRGDAVQLQLMLANLVKNAIEAIVAAEAPSRVVEVIAERCADGVSLEVNDSGPGWPGGSIELHLLQSSKPTGTGIGLFIVQATVENHGGSLEVGRSALGGASFRVFLPDVLD